LKSQKAKGPEPKLKGKQLLKIYDIITSKNPINRKFEFALWTREMIRELIRDKFSVRLSDVSVTRRPVLVGCAQTRAQQMFVTKDIQWQVAITAIVTVKEPAFLISMKWIICRIDIQNDLGRGRIMGLKKKINQ